MARKAAAKKEVKTASQKIEAKPVEKKVGEKDVLVFKAKEPLKPGQLKMLSEFIRKEQQRSGVNIVLMPYSFELEE